MCRSGHTSLSRVSAELEPWNQGPLLYLITSKGLIRPTELRWSVIAVLHVTTCTQMFSSVDLLNLNGKLG